MFLNQTIVHSRGESMLPQAFRLYLSAMPDARYRRKTIGLLCHGFTLVELLTTIAIMAILLALLMPSLRNALNTAKTASCTNNQRQLLTAESMYADDYHGWISQATTQEWINGGYRFITWSSRLTGKDSTGTCSLKNGPYIEDKKLFLCPSALPALENFSYFATYGMYFRGWIAGYSNDTWMRKDGFSQTQYINKVPRPSVIPMFADTIQSTTNKQFYYFVAGGTWENARVETRHNGSAILGFYDGHVAGRTDIGLLDINVFSF